MCHAMVHQTHILRMSNMTLEKASQKHINITIAITELTYFRQQYLEMLNVAFLKGSRYKEAFFKCP
jgi:hypothetical protein